MRESVVAKPPRKIRWLCRGPEPPSEGDFAEVELASNRQNLFVGNFLPHPGSERSVQDWSRGPCVEPCQVTADSEDRTFTATVVREPSKQVLLDCGRELILSHIVTAPSRTEGSVPSLGRFPPMPSARSVRIA